MYRHQKLIRSCLCLERISHNNQRWRSNALLCLLQTNQQLREYSNPARKPFWARVIENYKQDKETKEMQENLRKFREETEKFEKSDALKKARTKFEAVESGASKTSEFLKEKLGPIKDKIQETIDGVGKSEFVKKAEELGKSAQEAAKKISKSGEDLSKNETFKTVSEAAQAVRGEFESERLLYQAPSQLRKRKEIEMADEIRIEPNQEATGLELHKDSILSQSWQNFKENNRYAQKMFDLKTRYDESENIFIQFTRGAAEKVQSVFGTPMSATLNEICRTDPSFDLGKFRSMCETDIIPNVLEAMIRGDLEILRDWCHDGPYSILSTPIKGAQKIGAHFDSKVLDVRDVSIAAGHLIDSAPVLVIRFEAHQVMCLRDSKGKVLEGDPDTILNVTHVWCLRRDPAELNPQAAWRLLELSFFANPLPLM